MATAILPSHASAATQIYYSVGQNTLDHKTGSPAVTIDGSGNATFSVAQTGTTTGVGDVVTYGGSRAFITGKVSSTVWTVETATGGLPSATTSAPVTSIAHAFSSLNSAIGGGGSTSATASATSTNFLNTSDLVTGNYLLNIPLYYDSGPDQTAVTLSGYNTGASNYIRLYTPTSTASQVNQSQRHGGRWTSTAWSLDKAFGFSAALKITVPYTRLDGLQIRNTTSSGTAYGLNIGVSGTADATYVSNSIFSTSADKWSCVSYGVGGASFSLYAWNNVFTNCNIGLGLSQTTMGPTYVYNNTFYDTVKGIDLTTFGTAAVKAVNNLFGSTTYTFAPTGKAAAGSDYNSTSASTTGYIVSGGTGGHDRLNQNPGFVDIANIDFHLTTGDTSAKDVGSSTAADPNLAVVDDIDGNARPFNSVYDIGADEWDGSTGDVTPPVLSNGSPTGAIATSTTSTILKVTTSENATCKYDTNAGTAYASMANTFTNTGTTTHATTLSGLSSGHIYTYYVRCQDTVGNANASDYAVSFNVGTNGTAYANSCSMSDVQAAIGIAVAGDTVSIPAGTCSSWGTGGSSLSVSKAITLSGAGEDVTVLNIASTSPSYSGGAISVSAPVTIKNMTVYTWPSGLNNSTFVSVGGGVNGFRVTNIKYIDQQLSSGYFVYFGTGSYGLIDNNDITGGNGQNELIFGYGPSDSWQTPNSLGQSEGVFIEHNTFRGLGYLNDCNANSRCVVRYNTVTTSMKTDSHGLASNTPARGVRETEVYNNIWNSTNYGASTAIEMRGGTGMVFNNSAPNVANGANSAWFYLRDYGYDGGPWSNFGVTISSISVGNPTTITTATPHSFVDQQQVAITSSNSTPTVNSTYTITVTGPNTFTIPVNVTVAGTTGNASQFQTLFNYPVKDQIGVGMDPKVADSEPFYVWGNLKGGAAWPLTLPGIPAGAISLYNLQIGSTTATYTERDVVQSNRDYFADSGVDTSTTTVGVTSGLLSARPSTCSKGSAYWATDQGGSWDTSNGTSSDGALYKCVSANTWSLYYRPYAYPHYLTAASTTASDQVDIGAGARMFGNGKFYGFSTSTASGVYATIGATTSPITSSTATSSADYWLDLTVQTWLNSGTHEKAWTETSTSLGATTTHHMVGDLAANTQYNVKVDGSVAPSVISGPNCSSGTCTSDSSGKIYFDYTGGYSTHTFDVVPGAGIVPPTVTTDTPTLVSTSTLTFNATYVATGGENASNAGLTWGTVSTLSGGDTATSSFGSMSVTGPFSGGFAGLTPNTTYYVRAYAVNSAGTSTGSIVSTTTLSVSAPTVVTSAAASITSTGASFGASIANDGRLPSGTSGFAWGTSSNLSGGDTATTTGGLLASVSSLVCGTTYYARAYAMNTSGTGYGSIVSFTTSACAAVASGTTVSVPRPSSGVRHVVGPVQTLSTSLRSFIETLIALGVIPQDKAAAALAKISAPTTPSVPSQNLARGYRGPSVQRLQELLSNRGFLKATPNGVFGPQTFAALKSFQMSRGIPATGYYGSLTRAALAE